MEFGDAKAGRFHGNFLEISLVQTGRQTHTHTHTHTHTLYTHTHTHTRTHPIISLSLFFIRNAKVRFRTIQSIIVNYILVAPELIRFRFSIL